VEFLSHLLALYAPILWLALAGSAIWTYWRSKLTSLLGMAAGSLMIAAATSVPLWFSDWLAVRAEESASEAVRRIMEINLLSMAGMLVFVAATVELLRRIRGRGASA
jgi:hypothetical protein